MKIHHTHFETLNSTNEWAKKNLSSFEKEALTLISADYQTGGYGQFGRKWLSPKGENLYASFCFFIPNEKNDPLILTQLLMKSQMHILKEKGINCSMKWPNDILLNQKKIAGILCETIPFPPHLGVVIGIGLNVNMPAETLQTIDQPATSLFHETQKIWDINLLLEDLKHQFLNDLVIFKK